MSLTPIQERRLQQVQQGISFFEKETRKRDVWFALWFSGASVIILYAVGFLIDWAMDNISLSAFVGSISWVKIAGTWVFWFLFDYFFFVRSNIQHLNLKRKELSQLKVRYGLTEKSLS